MPTSITGQGISIYPAPDDALSSTSKRPVQNKVIDEELSDVKNAIDQLEDALEARATALNALVLKLLYVDPDVYSNEYKDFCTEYGVPWVDPDPHSTKDEWIDGASYTLDAIDGEYYQASNGEVKTYSGWSRTDYVICNGAAKISFPPMPQQSGATVNSGAWFDQNKAFVSNLTLSKTDTVVRNVPQNAYYFGISSETQALLTCIASGITPYAS